MKRNMSWLETNDGDIINIDYEDLYDIENFHKTSIEPHYYFEWFIDSEPTSDYRSYSNDDQHSDFREFNENFHGKVQYCPTIYHQLSKDVSNIDNSTEDIRENIENYGEENKSNAELARSTVIKYTNDRGPKNNFEIVSYYYC